MAPSADMHAVVRPVAEVYRRRQRLGPNDD